jgi:hypothetical protein
MADRKRKVKQAIQESITPTGSLKAKNAKPAAPKKDRPAPTLKNYALNPKEKAETAAEQHPRAGRSQRFRNKELQNSIASSRGMNPAENMPATGTSIIGHKKISSRSTIDGTSTNTYRVKRSPKPSAPKE